jgi:MinD-like ATPase involved in chromosome partitioning or flagellar assembly
LLNLISAKKLDVLILDTRAGINDDTILALAISDLLFIIVRPDQQDYQGTAVTVEIARRLTVPQTGLIANNVPSKIDPISLRRELENTYQCNVSAVIHFSTDMVSVDYPRVLALEDPHHPIIRTLKEMITPYVRP